MTSKHFCLKWTRFQTNILSAFESLQNTEDLADVTLTCDGNNIKAHKFILSACSPYFRTIFKENPCPHPIVILKDVAYADLMAIINFMYHGEVTVSEEQLSSFLHTAVILQVLGLMNTDETPQQKKQYVFPKKPKTSSESQESPQKKAKLSPKLKKSVTPPGNPEELLNEANRSTQFEVVEVDKIKTEDELGASNEYDVSENVEVVVGVKSDTPGSILEAALEVRDKPSSILERSLMAQAGRSPSSAPYQSDKVCVIQDLPKTVFIPRKPPEMDLDKRVPKSSSESSSPSTFEYPSEFLQQRIKTEDHQENFETLTPEEFKEMGIAARLTDLQPHHSSQCGNCPHCGKVYSNQSALKYHVRLVHSDLTNMYCCHLCPESFDYREGYKKHMAEVHLVRN